MPSLSRKILTALASLALVALFSFPVAAYDHPLDSYTLRDAYFLGTDSNRVARFLSRYVQTFSPADPDGPYVAQIEVRTPYVQVVENSRQHGEGYSAQDAESDYKKAADQVQVHIQILYPVTQPYPVQTPPACAGAVRMNDALACFGDFTFRFTQGKSLHASKTYGTPAYSIDGSDFDGGDLWFTFSAKEVASAPLRISVTNPAGQKVSATFDLAALR